MIYEIIKGKPHAVTSTGIELWIDKSLTRMAREERKLPNVTVCVARDPDQNLTRVILVDNEPEYESQSLEAIGVHLDIMAMHHHGKGKPE